MLPPQAPFTELWWSLGYNKLFTNFPNLVDFGGGSVSKTLTAMQMGSHFLENCNYMIGVQVFVLLLGAFLYAFSHII